MLTRARSYDEGYRALEWRIPEFFNMGVDVCDKHADATPNRRH